MQKRKPALALLCALALVLLAAGRVPAQEGEASRPPSTAPARAEVNHEVHLHLLVTAEGAEAGPRPPQSLDGVVRQLKSAFPSAEYRLAATFINRVRDGGGFEVKNAGLSWPNSAQPSGRLTPTSYQFSLSGVKLLDPSSAQPSINVQQFRLGMRAPVMNTSAAAEGGGGRGQVSHYEEVGLSTMLSVREGEPALVGTLGAPGQTFIVVLTIRRAGR